MSDSEPKIVFQGKMHEVIQQDVQTGAVVQTFERVRRAPGTRLIIVKGDKMLITKEHRREHNLYDFRLPGGKVFNKLQEFHEFLDSGADINKMAEQAARLEAKEEAGIDVTNIKLHTVTHCGATIEWDLFYFIVDDFVERKEGQELGDGEDVEVMWFTKDEVKKMCLDGSMHEDRSVAVLLRYLG